MLPVSCSISPEAATVSLSLRKPLISAATKKAMDTHRITHRIRRTSIIRIARFPKMLGRAGPKDLI